MPIYAQIDGDGIVVAETQTHSAVDAADMIEVEQFGHIGQRWTGNAFELMQAPAAPRRISNLALMRRLTMAERTAIEFSAIDNPNASEQQRLMAAAMRVYLKSWEQADYINLDDADLSAALHALEAAGVLSAGRADEVLGAPILVSEMP